MPVKEIILLSACLSGHLIRYNGTDKSCSSDLLQHWRKEGRLVTHCPELAAGLSTPPLSAERVSGQGIDVLNGHAQVLESDGRDCTRLCWSLRNSIVQAHACTKLLRQVKTCHQLR
jgi:uncharacterized protein YbbK (DUF523 family)